MDPKTLYEQVEESSHDPEDVRKFLETHPMPMQEPYRSDWLTALRSRQYRQNGHGLRSATKGYCCMGVACELFIERGGEGRWTAADALGNYTFVTGNDNSSCYPTDEVWNQLGVDAPKGTLLRAVLENFNDNAFWSFEKIADWIERYCPPAR